MSDTGTRIVFNYENEEIKSPGGLCYGIAAQRVEQAYRDVFGRNMTEMFPPELNRDVFDNLWKSHCYMSSWLDETLYPRDLRAKGAAAALAFAGEAVLVDQEGVWKGELLPGAVLQIWNYREDYIRVRDFDIKRPQELRSFGHSFLFLDYVRDGDGHIIGMRIADQSDNWMPQETETFIEKYFEFWVAANLTRNFPQGSVCGEPDAVSALLSGHNALAETQAVNYNIHYCRKVHRLDPQKIAAAMINLADPNGSPLLKQAISGFSVNCFNIHFAQLTALFQLQHRLTVDGKFGDHTCMTLTGVKRSEADIIRHDS